MRRGQAWGEGGDEGEVDYPSAIVHYDPLFFYVNRCEPTVVVTLNVANFKTTFMTFQH